MGSPIVRPGDWYDELPPIRIIIAGGRDFGDYDQLCGEVQHLTLSWSPTTFERLEVVSGGARGADSLGALWSQEVLDKKPTVFEPDYVTYSNSKSIAPFRRNTEMAKYASEGNPYGILCAFWDGKSRGTKHMIGQALDYGLEVHVYRYDRDLPCEFCTGRKTDGTVCTSHGESFKCERRG